MAATTLQEFVAVLGYRIDESAQRRFTDAIDLMGKKLEGLSLGLSGIAAAVVTSVASMASSAEQMYYLGKRTGETVGQMQALAFALSKLGVPNPNETLQSIQNIGDALRDNPGFRSLWNVELGKGSINDQLIRLGERYKNEPNFRSFIENNLAGPVGISDDELLALGRPDVQKYINQYLQQNKATGYDPQQLSKESVAFENQLRDLESKVKSLWGGLSQQLLPDFTGALKSLNTWLDTNGPSLDQKLLAIEKGFIADLKEAADDVKNLIGWFEQLTPAQQKAIEAFAAIGAVFLAPGWAGLFLAIAGLKELIDDYNTFEKTVKSPLHIPWGDLSGAIKSILTPLGGVVTQFGLLNTVVAGLVGFKLAGWIIGLINPLGQLKAALAALIAPAVATTAATAGGGGAVAGGGILAGLASRLRGLIGRVGGPATAIWLVEWMKNHPHDNGEDFQNKLYQELTHNETTGANSTPNSSTTSNSKTISGGSAVPGGPAGTTQSTSAIKNNDSPGWFQRLWDFISPISSAKAAELPDNVKNLNQSVQDLTATMVQNLILQTALSYKNGFGSPGGGGNGSIGGGGGSTASVHPLNFNDPKVLQAIKFFMSQGRSWTEAIGIVAGLYSESGLDPNAFNPAGGGSGALGIAQWRGDRQKMFQQVEGVPLAKSTYQQQLDYVNWELNHTEKSAGDALGKATNVAGVSVLFGALYERPGPGGDPANPYYATQLGNKYPLTNSAFTTIGGDKNVNMTQNNNVTVTGSNDPNATGAVLQDILNSHAKDMTRNLQGNVQ